MLTIKGPVRYEKPAAVPAMAFDAAIQKMSKRRPAPKAKQIDFAPAFERERASLIRERDKLMRELRRVENILAGVDYAMGIVFGGVKQSNDDRTAGTENSAPS